MITYPTKLQKVLLGGGCEQMHLPEGFTHVEDIYGDGNQYINTGVTVPSTFHIKMEVKFKSFSPQNGFLCGARNQSNAQGRFGFSIIRINQKLGFDVNAIANYRNITSNLTANTWYTVELIVGATSTKFLLDGVLIQETNSRPTVTNYPVYVYDCNTANEITAFTGAFSLRNFEIKGLYNIIPVKNSSNVVGAYDIIDETFETNAGTGTFTAGPDVVPTPDAPIDIVCNNGVLKVSKNLFDYDYFYDNYQMYDTSMVGRCPIKLKPNTTYTVSTNRDSSEEKSLVFVVSGSAINWDPITANNGVTSNSPRTVTTDSEGYLCFGIYVQGNNGVPESEFISGTIWVQIEEGSTTTTYMPYKQIYTDGTTETVQSTGKNLYNPATRTNGYYIDFDGNLAENAIFSCSALIPVVEGSVYTWSGTSTRNTSTNKRCHGFNSNGEWVQQIGYIRVGSGNYSLSVTIPSGIAYIRISGMGINDYPDTNVQLELGSTATAYEPYTLLGTATAEMLLAVGDYKDTQEVLTGLVTHNIGAKVLDGSENLEQSNTKNDVYCLTLTDAKREQQAILSTHFIGTDATDANMPSNSIKVGSYASINNYGVIAIRLTDVTTLASFKQYLAFQYAQGTPVIIVYPLATPTTEQVTPQPLAGSSATVTAGSIDNLPIESSIIAELKKRYIGDKEVKRVYIGNNLVWEK